MVLRQENLGRHDDCCSAGSSAAWTRASISAAFAADPNLENSAIVLHSLGPIIILEGYIADRDQREIAIQLAEGIVGVGKVRDRMLMRFSQSN